MGSFIDGFQDIEIRVSIKFSLIYVVLIIRVQKNTWSTENFILFVAYFKQKPQCMKTGSFCFGLLYLSKSI